MAKAKPAAEKRAKSTVVKSTTAKSTVKSKPKANPLLTKWKSRLGVPPFKAIKPDHYRPAFDAALKAHEREIARISAARTRPTFTNTIVALEKAGAALGRVSRVFFNLASSDTNPELQAIEREMSPRLARHSTAINLDAGIFKRIDELHERRATLKLDAEQLRLLERYHKQLVRAGARLEALAKKRMGDINERLATLGTQFAQNVLAEEQSFRMELSGEADLAGLPDFVRAAAARMAADLGQPGKHIITLSRSSIEPFLQFSTRRDLRETAFKAWTRRGDNDNDHDNRAIAAETIALRGERAALLGYRTFADFRLDDAMAKSPAAVRGLLDEVWAAAVPQAGRERERLEDHARKEGQNIRVEAWDWRFYAERVRKAQFDLDEGEIKPYLQLDRIIEAAFDTASRLFGLTFKERNDLGRYHPDVRTFEVTDKDGRHIGVFIGDYFGRPSKRSGAWMSTFRGQRKLGAEERPIVVNVMSFARGADGEPTLLSFDDARTLFHEFGHALHGLLSDVTYPSLACTAVATDFVELPSQLYEHWLSEPDVLKCYALHYKTGKPMPQSLLDRLKAARTFNQGFATVEYVASAIADLELHSLDDPKGLDIRHFETQMLERRGMPREIVMRHRLPHFAHIFSGGGYASGYYSYMWSEVMDADAFDAFTETGDVFDAATAGRLKEFIYSAGNRRDPAEAYTAFRGRLPTTEAMLKKRGLAV